MKRLVFTLSFFLLLSSTLYASTNVPSSIGSDTTWDQSGSPYLISGKVVVAKGATLQVEEGVQVIFQGASALEVDGTLNVQGAAAAPAVFNMIEGGLQSELFVNGGEAHIANAKVLSGVFLAKDSTLTMDGSEITKGSGLYLQGATTASLKNNKIYGNATGVVLDGQIKATLTFNTLVQNTYGLFIKSYSELECSNNSIHDNQKEVVNNTPAFKLGGNYWGTEDANAVQAKIQGPVDVKPVKSLKDVLRVYVRTQLPVITKKMELALIAKEKREAKEEAAQLARIQKGQTKEAKKGEAPPAPAPAEQTAPTEQAAAPETPAPSEEAPAEVAAPSPTNKIASVKSLAPAPHTLKPLANLPPAQNIENPMAASAPPSTSSGETAGTQPAANPPEAPQPPATAATTSESTVPAVPEAEMTVPPAPAAGGEAVPPPPAVESSTTVPPAAGSETIPPPPEAASTSSSAPAGPSGQASSSQASTPPAPPDMGNMTPPDIETTSPPAASTAPAAPATTNAASSKEAVPAPPDLNEQVPASANAVPEVPAPPPATANTSANVPAPAPAAANIQPTTDQQKAVDNLGTPGGDIDGMQAPPLDLGPDLSNSTAPTADQLLGTGQPSAKSGGTTASAPATNNSGLTLPPLQDKDVAPPKDLDLPPMDDLGNVNLDSRNK